MSADHSIMGDHALILSESRDTKRPADKWEERQFLALEEPVRARGNYTPEELAALTEGVGRADRRAEQKDSNHTLTYATSQRENSQQDFNCLQMRKRSTSDPH